MYRSSSYPSPLCDSGNFGRFRSPPQRGLGHFLRSSSVRLSGYLSRVGANFGGGGGKRAALRTLSSRSRVNLFYGHSQQLGGQVRIKVEHAQLVIKLIDHGGQGGGVCGSSVPLGPGKGSLTLTKVDLLEVKVKRGGGGGLPLGGGSWGDSARVQFKLKPGTLYAHQVRLGLLDGGRVQEAAVRRLEEAQGNVGKLEVHFPPETMASLVEEMVVSRFLRKVRYGFLRLRTMLVPSKWY
ncbi:hypothetical protein TYRP_005528 [Tyrophagus putrescentiae]|nr:hypothetical protein TYRP_005528 [Tyrophagus putrescentiae]